MNKESIKLLPLYILLALTIWVQISKMIEKRKAETLISALQSDLVISHTTDSLQKAKIQVIETERAKDFVKLKVKDQTIKELQDVVKEYKDIYSAAIIKNQTLVKAIAKTQIVFKDTVKQGDTIYVYPEYRSTFNLDNWVYGNTKANRATTEVDLKIRNEYAVVIRQEKKGLFSKPITYAEVINRNPYTETTDMRVYQVTTPKPKQFGVGPVIGIGYTTSNKIEPYIGVGLQWSLFRF